MNHETELRSLLAGDAARVRILGLVRSLGLPDCWIAAGFVRSAVWDCLHGFPPSTPGVDVDVVWFDRQRVGAAEDQRLEQRLTEAAPDVDWSVKNQSRMHERNGDPPYCSVADAIRCWPETATAVAVRQGDGGALEITAPFGLDDLFALIVKPTPRFAGAKRQICRDRVRQKQWLARWPRLVLAGGSGEHDDAD